MSQIDLKDVTSGYNLIKINANFNEIERVLNEEVLHRVNPNGSVPNTLETAIDANNQHIYNLAKPTSGGEPLRLKDLFGDPDELLQGPDLQSIPAVAGQTVFNLSTNYVPGSNSIYVFLNGVLLINTEYSESSTTTITLTDPADAGDILTFVPISISSGGGGTGSSTTATNIGTGKGVFKAKVGDNFQFKTLTQGSNITLTANADDVRIDGVASNTEGVNLGASGEPVFASRSGSNLQFKKIKPGSNISLTSDSESITINSTGGGGGGSALAVLDNGVSKTAGATSLNFVNTVVGVAGSAITITAPSGVFLNVKDYGAIGNGVADDSSAINSAIAAAKSTGKSLFFPDGVYTINSLPTQSGTVRLVGTGSSVLKGTFTYYDGTFPISADTNTPVTPTSPFFSAQAMKFESTTSDYALKLSTIQQGGFLSTFSLTDCKFYGSNGLLCQHMIGFDLNNCEFNNRAGGIRLEGCVNGLFTACRFQNHAAAGVYITKHATSNARAGGENMRFVNCEWAVCTYGIVAQEHMWLTIDSCLLDYCDVPLFLYGSTWAKAVNTYFGASTTSSSRFSGVPGYLAPSATGVAVYGLPGGTPVGNRVVGFTAHNCEFINYVSGSVQPIVYIEGYVSGAYPKSADEVAFHDCLFYASAAHSSPTLLEISNVQVVRVIGNRFRSFNLSSSMANSYRTHDCIDWINHSNSFHLSRQSGNVVRSSYESGAGTVVALSEPTSTYPGMIWVLA